LISNDHDAILMAEAWLRQLAERRADVKARLNALLEETRCASYLNLAPEELDGALDKHVEAIIGVLGGGSEEALFHEVSARARIRASSTEFQLRDMLAIFLLTRRVLLELADREIPKPEARSAAIRRISDLLDAAVLTVASAFAATREEMIRRQQAELADITEVVREEIEALDRNIVRSVANLRNLGAELRDQQEYREALLEKLLAIRGLSS